MLALWFRGPVRSPTPHTPRTGPVPRDSPKFLTGIRVLSSVSEKNLDSKITVFEKSGWTRTDVLALVRANPYCLALSEARIKKSLEYFAKEVGYDIPYLISHSVVFGYSLENRIVPRNRVLLALKEKGLIRGDYALYSILALNESRFLKRKYMIFMLSTWVNLWSPLTEGRAGSKSNPRDEISYQLLIFK
ncbi:Transcription termination factor MTEF18 mitochondrial, partial [Bienertia sinuspersici]